MNIFTIGGAHYKGNCFPSLNDLLRNAEKHPRDYNNIKREMQGIAIACARRDLRGWKPSRLCRLNITWGEKRRGQVRDQDNVIGAGRKIINDALVKCGVLKDDKPTYLVTGEDKFVYSDVPFIRVEIEEL